jgi:hypothetical protein
MKTEKCGLAALVLIFFGMVACNDAQTTKQTPIIESPAPVAAAPDTAGLPALPAIQEIKSSTAPVAIPPPSGLKPNGPLSTLNGPFASPGAPQSTVSAPAAQAPKATANKGPVNPAHGQPGHNCAIAVGAPLSSAPTAKPAPAPVQAQTVSSPLVTAAQPTPVANAAPAGNPKGKVNPAHGQPGHNCAVAVGAPLP